MKLFPKGRDGWIGFLLFPFKTFVVAAPIVCHLLSLYVNGSWHSRYGADVLISGLVLCIPILLLGALLQAAACKRGESLKTLVFVGIAFLILFYPAFYPPPSNPSIVSDALNLVVLCYSAVAFHRTKLKGFLYLLLGCSLSMVSFIANMPVLIRIANRPFGNDIGAYQDYVTFFGLVSLAAQFLYAAGIILIIHHFLKNFSKKSPQ
jgi:hypothetical protein